MEKYKVIETNKNNIVREFNNLNIYEAEEVYFKLINNYSVRQGYNKVRIIKNK